MFYMQCSLILACLVAVAVSFPMEKIGGGVPIPNSPRAPAPAGSTDSQPLIGNVPHPKSPNAPGNTDSERQIIGKVPYPNALPSSTVDPSLSVLEGGRNVKPWLASMPHIAGSWGNSQ